MIEFMTHCFRVGGDNTAKARYRATDIADKLGSARVDYDKLKKCNEDDMDAVLKSVKLPSDTEKDQIANMILGEILSLKVTLLHIELKYAEKATSNHLTFI